MKAVIETINGLIAANQAEPNRTPYLDVAGNALRTAHDQWLLHEREMERIAEHQRSGPEAAAK